MFHAVRAVCPITNLPPGFLTSTMIATALSGAPIFVDVSLVSFETLHPSWFSYTNVKSVAEGVKM